MGDHTLLGQIAHNSLIVYVPTNSKNMFHLFDVFSLQRHSLIVKFSMKYYYPFDSKDIVNNNLFQ